MSGYRGSRGWVGLVLIFCLAWEVKAMEVMGHRGDQERSLENTMSAFLSAFDGRASGAECDIMLTADGQIIAFHDDTLERLAHPKELPTSKKVIQMTYKKLAAIELRDPQRPFVQGKIPLLADLLDALPSHKKLLIELKAEKFNEDYNLRLIDRLTDLILIGGYSTENLVFISFHFPMLKILKEVFDRKTESRAHVKTMGITMYKKRGEHGVYIPMLSQADYAINLTSFYHLDGLFLELASGYRKDQGALDKQIIYKIKSSGLEVGMWSPGQFDTFENFNLFLLSPLDYYNTNFPDKYIFEAESQFQKKPKL